MPGRADVLEQIPMTQIPRECECLCGRVCYLARAEGAIGSGRRREYLNLRDGRWNARPPTRTPGRDANCDDLCVSVT